ncbi:TRADD-N-associated membrane domain-containing protein [Crossiella sp. CA198]|uniref:TRADD-N-associated membrane domain-containing protein n=1 Tax=Crossiella sp. CA198 TaxID=3455607 RepID=UPI003F8D8089
MDSWVAVAGLLFFVVGVAGALLPSVSVLRHQLRTRRRGRSPVRELAEGVAAGLRREPAPAPPSEPGDPDPAPEPEPPAGARRPEADFTARQLQLYADYHETALTESSLSFRLAAGAAGVGFLVILASVGILVFQGGDAAWLGTASGVVCEAVAALFLSEARSTRERAARMFDLLNAEVVRSAHTMRAVEMAAALRDDREREQLLAAIALKLMDVVPLPQAPAPGEEPAAP